LNLSPKRLEFPTQYPDILYKIPQEIRKKMKTTLTLNEKTSVTITCGKETCASTPGSFCYFFGTTHLGTRPVCLLLRDSRGDLICLYEKLGDQKGWTQRCQKCRELEVKD